MNTHINLLPSTFRQQKNTQFRLFKKLMWLLLLTMSFCGLMNIYLSHVVSNKSIQYKQLLIKKQQIILAIKTSQAQKNTLKQRVMKDAWMKKILNQRDSIVVSLTLLQTMILPHAVQYRIERHHNRLQCMSGCRNGKGLITL